MFKLRKNLIENLFFNYLQCNLINKKIKLFILMKKKKIIEK